MFRRWKFCTKFLSFTSCGTQTSRFFTKTLVSTRSSSAAEAGRRGGRYRRSPVAPAQPAGVCDSPLAAPDLLASPLPADDMPLNDRADGGLSAWSRRWWRALAAETLATALLVLLGLASLVPLGPVQLTHPAFGFGLVIVMLVQVFGPVSGAHMNPAITLAAVLTGYMEILVALAYFVAQTIGAFIGYGTLLLVVPRDVMSPGVGCAVPSVAPGAAAALEAALTGLLALLACSCWAAHDPARPDHTVPLKFGLGVAGLIYAGGEISKASLNPVRALAPAVFMNVWQHHWVYWVGPLGGAALAAALHRALLTSRTPARAPEALPLHDKATP